MGAPSRHAKAARRAPLTPCVANSVLLPPPTASSTRTEKAMLPSPSGGSSTPEGLGLGDGDAPEERLAEGVTVEDAVMLGVPGEDELPLEGPVGVPVAEAVLGGLADGVCVPE